MFALTRLTFERARKERLPQVAGSLTFTTLLSMVPLLPLNGDAVAPKPAAIPSLSWSNLRWSTWLIANITMNSTISRVIMSA